MALTTKLLVSSSLTISSTSSSGTGSRQSRRSLSLSSSIVLPVSSSSTTKKSKRLVQPSSSFSRGICLVTTRVLKEEKSQIELDTTGGGGGGSGIGNSGGSGGGGGGGDSNSNNNEDDTNDNKKKKMAMSMSQKLTLGYAALVGVGGVMGYMKSGSQKSLAAGGLSALLLYYVYTELPLRPVFASSLGFGLSVALLAVMGSRFRKSGKVFPAGLVSFISLIMTGGYLHGILRSMH